MSPMFPFLTGMVPPLVKDKLMERAEPQPIIEEERRPIVEEVTRVGQPVGIGNLQQAFMQRGPLSRLSQFINQELAEENQGEVQEFIGEVGDMANQRFGVDLGSVGQRPMFNQLARPAVQMYEKGGAAFPDVTGPGGGPPDGKVTQADVLKLRGVELKEYGGPIGMQMGGDPMMAAGMPMPPQPAPEQPPMPIENQLDPNVVQSALAQAAGGIGDLDEAQNYEQVMNTMRGDQATVEERREELAGVVGPGDANQTPESVLTLVQPVMMLANVDQGIGQLAQQEMTQPMEGPMAGGIMSTVPEPPMMEAGGTAPVNFNKGGEVRPVQYFNPLNTNRVVGLNLDPGTGTTLLNQLSGIPNISQFGASSLEKKLVAESLEQEQKQPGTGKDRLQQLIDQTRPIYRKLGLGDPEQRAADLEQQKRLTRAQMLFDIAQTALTFAAPMEGERPGLSPAERLAMAASRTKLPQTIGARAQAQFQAEKEAKKEERAIDLAVLQSAETKLAAEKAQAAALDLAREKQKGTVKAQKAYVLQQDFTLDGEEVKKDTVVNLTPMQVSKLPQGILLPYKAPDTGSQANKAFKTTKDVLINGKPIKKDTIVVLTNDEVAELEPDDLIPFVQPSTSASKPYTTTRNVNIGGRLFPKGQTLILFPDQVKEVAPDALRPYEKDTPSSTNPFYTTKDITINNVVYPKNSLVNLTPEDQKGLDKDALVPYSTPDRDATNILMPDNSVVSAIPGTSKYNELINEKGGLVAGNAEIPDDDDEVRMGSKAKTDEINYITNPERLKKYASGELDKTETNAFEQKLIEYASTPSTVFFGGEFRTSNPPPLSRAIQDAIKERIENGLPTVDLPDSAFSTPTQIQKQKQKTPTQDSSQVPVQDFPIGSLGFNLSLFGEDGSVNFNSPSWDKIPTNIVDKNLDYPETTGLLSVVQRAKNYFGENLREIGGAGLDEKGKKFSRAESDLITIRNEILNAITQGTDNNDRILKFVQLQLAEETQKLSPGMFTTDETALSKLLAVEGKIAYNIQTLKNRIPEYGGDPGLKYNQSQITNARAYVDKLVLLAAEVRTMRKIYQEALEGGSLAVTPENISKAKDWLKGNRTNQKKDE